MTLHIDDIEAAWLALNLATIVLTAWALVEAVRDRRAVRRGNGRAREIAVAGAVRREAIRLILQSLLLSAVLPGLASDRDVDLSWPVVALMSAIALLFVQTVLDARERRELDREVALRYRQAGP